MEIIDRIEERLNGDKKFNIFFDIYSFTNENISGYLPYFDLKDKSLLTVGSSCDQVLNASFVGSDDITICDICPLTRYYYYLKMASLYTLSREEYLIFLCQTYYGVNNPYFLNYNDYEKVKDTLKSFDYDSFYLWDYLFNCYTNSDLFNLFRKDNNSKDDIVNCNNYLKNEQSYKIIKSAMLNTSVSFINGNVTNEEYNRTFDNIWLSNVAHYLNRKEIQDMFFDSERVLNENGKMLVCYFWNNITSDKDYITKELNDKKTSIITIPGINVHYDNSIILYEKPKSLCYNKVGE